jgi:hypothetical protein
MVQHVSTYGIYPSMAAVLAGTEALRAARFRQTDISVLYSDKPQVRRFFLESPEAAMASVATGLTLGGLLSYLAGIGALNIPGFGPILAAGPLVAALASIGAGTARNLLSALAGLGIPEYEAARYEGRLKEGGILLSVHCDDSRWMDEAKTILQQTGAEHVAAAAGMERSFQP